MGAEAEIEANLKPNCRHAETPSKLLNATRRFASVLGITVHSPTKDERNLQDENSNAWQASEGHIRGPLADSEYFCRPTSLSWADRETGLDLQLHNRIFFFLVL